MEKDRNWDIDLEEMSDQGLFDEVKKLRGGIRLHRDTSLTAPRWDWSEIWSLLPEKITPTPSIPEDSQFLSGCAMYIASFEDRVSQGNTVGRSDKPIDYDIELMSRDQKIKETLKLRNGIRQFRDLTGQNLCWHHPILWGLLPVDTDPIPEFIDTELALTNCKNFKFKLDKELPNAPRIIEEYRDVNS